MVVAVMTVDLYTLAATDCHVACLNKVTLVILYLQI